MPRLPIQNCTRNVTLNPMKMSAQAVRPQRSEYIRPVILGHQWCSPPIIAIRAPPIIV
jgi:hypothetical protein